MKFKCVIEYEYPVEHKPPVKAEIVLHGDRVTTDKIVPYKDRPHGEWIPCSERLPKDCEIVLASFKTGVVQMCKYFDSGRDDSWWSYKDDCFAWDNTVVAWMPMPTPYQKEGERNVTNRCY